MEGRQLVSVLDLAKHRGIEENENGNYSMDSFSQVGLPMLGGCYHCAASIAAYNAYPGKNGYLHCKHCIDEENGWTDVKRCNDDLFGNEEIDG